MLSLVGLALVLDLTGDVRIDPLGVLFALLAALGLAFYFLLADHDEGIEPLPPLALAGGGLVVGFVVLVLAAVVQVLPVGWSTADVALAGRRRPVVGAGPGARASSPGPSPTCSASRPSAGCGSTVASFVALTEVVFAVLFAWWLLDELPGLVQLAGGVLIVAGVVAVRLGETRR